MNIHLIISFVLKKMIKHLLHPIGLNVQRILANCVKKNYKALNFYCGVMMLVVINSKSSPNWDIQTYIIQNPLYEIYHEWVFII